MKSRTSLIAAKNSQDSSGEVVVGVVVSEDSLVVGVVGAFMNCEGRLRRIGGMRKKKREREGEGEREGEIMSAGCRRCVDVFVRV